MPYSIETLAPNLFAAVLAGLFLVFSAINWWMDMVQNTTRNISRANDQPMEVCLMLNPYFIRLAFPITLAKWSVAGLYGWAASWEAAVTGLFLVWLVGVVSPVPLSITMPSVLKKVEQVRALDARAGEVLDEMISRWEEVGRKRY